MRRSPSRGGRRSASLRGRLLTAPYRPTQLEIAGGFVPGRLTPLEPIEPIGQPRQVLESMLAGALHRGPCFVAFSGGRDSSAVLALAAHVARCEGLPPPIAVIMDYPGAQMAQEREWQDLVLSHLGMQTERIDGSSARDLLGPLGRHITGRFGPIWPPTMSDQLPLFDLAQGGTLLTGEGGDEILSGQRITPVVGVWRTRRRPDREVCSALAFALAPKWLRRVALRRAEMGQRSWLKPDALRQFTGQVRRDASDQPLRWDRAVRAASRTRSAVLGLRSLALVAAERGTALLHPFLQPEFVDAFAAMGGRFGLLNRREALECLCGDLLPAKLMARTSKAVFNGPSFGPDSRAFIDSWNGGGLPDDLVDPELVLVEWSKPMPHAGTMLLLQQAWWSTQLPNYPGEAATGSRSPAC